MPAQAPVTVLVVDDEPEIRGVLMHYLIGEGFAVESVANGSEMTEVLANSPLI